MGYSSYVGRVGALAVALGVGCAIASPAATAWADSTESSSPSSEARTESATQDSSASSPDAASSDRIDPDDAAGADDTNTSGDVPDASSPSADTVEVAPGVTISNSGGARPSTEPEEGPEDVEADGGDSHAQKSRDRDHADTDVTTAAVIDATPQTPAQIVRAEFEDTIVDEPVVENRPVEIAVSPLAVASSPTEDVAATPVPSTITTALEDVVAPLLSRLLGTVPGGPADAPLGWVFLAAARRQFKLSEASVAGQPLKSVATTLTVTDADVPPVTNVAEIDGVTDPNAVAITGSRIYVANKSTGTVSVIDAATNTVVEMISVGVSPDRLVVKNDGTKLYVSSQADNSITVVNTSTGAVISKIAVMQPSAMAISSGGTTLYVTSADTGTLVRISTWTNTVTATVKLPAGSMPTDIVVSPDKTKLYVISNTATGAGTVAVIGYVSSISTAIADLPAAPTGLAVSPDNQRLYVSSADGTLTVIDTATKAVVATHTVTGVPAGVVVSGDGTVVLVTDTAGFVTTLDAATGTVLNRSATRASTTPMSVSPATALSLDGATLYITDYDADKVYVVPTAPGNQPPRAGAPTMGAPSAWSGTITGSLGATDPEGDGLTYTIEGMPSKGSVTVRADGTFTYTPTASARHAAATVGASPSLTTDTFSVTVSDGNGGSVVATVTVDISPANRVPVVSAKVYSPSATTGVVIGYVTSSDGDFDVRTYTATVQPAKGTVVVTATNGMFTYTPTAEARHAAARLDATAEDTFDTFTVTVDDGHGGVVSQTVTVAIRPTNATPTTPTVVTSSTDSDSGTVTGAVSATDTDNDTLSYSASAANKGTLTMQSDGTFTYTPTLAARQAAGAAGATAADKTETVTVTVVDGYGGTATSTLTLTIAPHFDGSGAPTNGHAQVNDPTLAIGAVTGTVIAEDGNGGTLTYMLETAPTRGLVRIDPTTGAFTYTPDVEARYAARNTEQIDTDIFTVVVSDGSGATTTVTVQVEVAPPIAAAMDQRGTTVALNVQEMYFYTQAETDMALDLLKEAGVTDIRILVPWAGVEWTDDAWTWSAIDRVVNGAAARDIEVLAVLNSTPMWAAVPNTPLLSGRPADPQEFAEYASMVATRYAGKISAYEIWNEPNYLLFWAPGPSAAQYTELLKAAYPVIKAADPDAVVVAGSVAAILDFFNVTVNPVRFIEDMYASGAAGYFDALSFHPYLYGLKFSDGGSRVNSPMDQVQRIHELMVANGDGNKKIWATEYGQPSSVESEASQAKYLGDFLRTWRGLSYAGPAFIHTIRDTNDSEPTTASLGLWRQDWTPKDAVAEVIEVIEENQARLDNPSVDL